MTLYPYQVPHFQRVLSIYRDWYAYIDTSQTGKGKTIIAIEVSKALDLPLLVIGELSIQGMWRAKCKEYGAKLIDFMTYARLRGNNPYLDKRDKGFVVSRKMKEMIDKGIMVVYDECHNLKNKSLQSEAACTISEYIVTHSDCSRIACLSATPIDKHEQMLQLMRIAGVITYDKFYEYDRSEREYIYTGIQQMIDFCYLIANRDDVNKILPPRIDNKNIKDTSYSLYQKFIKPRISSAIEGTIQLPNKDVANGYYGIGDAEQLTQAVGNLARVVGWRNGDIDRRSMADNFGMLTTVMRSIEMAKVPIMVRLAKETLKKPGAKVILYLNYLDCIDEVRKQLTFYRPLVMTGDVKSQMRDIIIEQFNAPTDEYRLLIANTRVAGTGINLDDTHGQFPRFMYMIPTYNFIDLHQATGRIYRTTTRSEVTVRIVYGKESGEKEKRILDALQRKSKVTRGVVGDSTVLYPGDYPVYIE